jgi:hypothetical protein
MWNNKQLEMWFNFSSFLVGWFVGYVIIGVEVHNLVMALWGCVGIISMGFIVTKSKELLDRGYPED